MRLPFDLANLAIGQFDFDVLDDRLEKLPHFPGQQLQIDFLRLDSLSLQPLNDVAKDFDVPGQGVKIRLDLRAGLPNQRYHVRFRQGGFDFRAFQLLLDNAADAGVADRSVSLHRRACHCRALLKVLALLRPFAVMSYDNIIKKSQ